MLIGKSKHDKLGLIPFGDVAAVWPGDVIADREVERWVFEDICPNDIAIWQAGQALASAGCAWSSGFWLLWATGRYARCMQILAIAFQVVPELHDCIEDLWQMIAHAHVLRTPTALDGIPVFVHAYVKNKEPSESSIVAALDWYNSRSPEHGVDASTTVVVSFINRELTKLFWATYDYIKEVIEFAAKVAFEDKNIIVDQHEHHDALLASAYVVAESASDSLDILDMKEVAILSLLAQWLNLLDIKQAKSLYPRPVKSAFDASVSGNLLDIPAYRAFQSGLNKEPLI